MERFTGQIALITGASSGIGRAIAQDLGTRGAILCLVGRKVETLELITESIRAPVPDIRNYQADLVQDKDIQDLVACLQRDYRHIDILIHSAGVISMGRFDQARLEDLDWQYKINLRAAYAVTQALLPMVRSCRGQVVFINSSAGLSARSGLAQYAATKHALKAIADSLRNEVNADGVR